MNFLQENTIAEAVMKQGLIYRYTFDNLKYPKGQNGWQKPEPYSKGEKERLLKKEPTGIGLLTGVNGLEVIDFDNHFNDANTIAGKWYDMPGVLEIINKYDLPIEETQSGGFHVFYRAFNVEKNTKLAERLNSNDKPETLIETRGKGGFIVCSPSPGYELLEGTLENIPEITPEERNTLIQAAKAFNEVDVISNTEKQAKNNLNGQTKPGEKLTESDTKATLQAHGWQETMPGYWKRPGKDTKGISATLGKTKSGNTFYVFSSNADPFEADTSYTYLGVYATLEHGSDYKAAAKALAKKYGMEPTPGKASSKSKQPEVTKKEYPEQLSGKWEALKNYLQNNDITIRYNEITQKMGYVQAGTWYNDINRLIANISYSLENEHKLKGITKGKIKEMIASDAIMQSFIPKEDPEATGGIKTQDFARAIQAKENFIFYNEYFYQYNGTRWERYTDDQVKTKVFAHLEKISQDAKKRTIADVFEVLKYLAAVNEVNKAKSEINLLNGVYNIHTHTFTEHNEETKSKYFTNVHPVTYNPKADATPWVNFLNEVFEGDTDKNDKIRLLQEFFGYSFTLQTGYQKALYLIGHGANGKSVIAEVLRQMLGSENVAGVYMENLNKDAQMVNLEHKNLNIDTEITKATKTPTKLLKAAIHGDALTAEPKYKNAYTFTPTTKFLFSGNHKPVTSDRSKGFFRSLIFLRFNNEFSPDQAVKHLEQKLFNEAAPGIFNWAMEGLQRLKNSNDFTLPESSKNEMEEYQEEASPVAAFVNENCKIQADAYESVKNLYQEFKSYCVEYGFFVMSNRAFLTELEGYGVKKTQKKMHGTNKKVYQGITLVTEDADNTDGTENLPF